MYLPLLLSPLNTNNKLLFRFKDTKLSTNIKSEYKREKLKKKKDLGSKYPNAEGKQCIE